MNIFVEWLMFRLREFWKTWGHVLKWVGGLAYFAWALVCLAFMFAEREMNSWEIVSQERLQFIRQYIIPLAQVTVILPIITVIIYFIGRYFYHQYLDYQLFASGTSKRKNDEKLKNFEKLKTDGSNYDDSNDEDDSNEIFKDDDDADWNKTVDDMATNSYRYGYRQGIRRAFGNSFKLGPEKTVVYPPDQPSQTAPRVPDGMLYGIDPPAGIDSAPDDKMKIDMSKVSLDIINNVTIPSILNEMTDINNRISSKIGDLNSDTVDIVHLLSDIKSEIQAGISSKNSDTTNDLEVPDSDKNEEELPPWVNSPPFDTPKSQSNDLEF